MTLPRLRPLLPALALLGCAACARQAQVPDRAAAPAPAAKAGAPAEAAGPRHSYLVRRGDSLWAIAARPGVLGDPFQWPLLFRQNRDQISDPDLIQPRQDLSYHAVPDAALLAQIRKEAEETPPYAPHPGARKVLPIQY